MVYRYLPICISSCLLLFGIVYLEANFEMKFSPGDRVKHVLFGNGTVRGYKKKFSYYPVVVLFDKGLEESFSEEFLTPIVSPKK